MNIKNLMPLRTKGEYLCIDTELFNALNHAGLSYTWDYKNKGLKFENNADYERAMQLKAEHDKLFETPLPQEVVSKTSTAISNVPKNNASLVNNKVAKVHKKVSLF